MAELSHLDESGAARMVDVSGKADTDRTATAEALVVMQRSTLDLIERGGVAKGDVLATARIAGIMAAKRTPDLIPLCHPLPVTGVTVDLERTGPGMLRIEATVKTTGKTGVEMEALTAVSVAALTVYDMCKAVEKGIRIDGVRLLEKHGGKSGSWIEGVERPAPQTRTTTSRTTPTRTTTTRTTPTQTRTTRPATTPSTPSRTSTRSGGGDWMERATGKKPR